MLVNADSEVCDGNSTAAECLAGSDSYATGALINGSLKLLVNVQWMPRYALPDGADWPEYPDFSGNEHRDWLFDVSADPTESTDLLDEYPEAYAALKARFLEWSAAAAEPAFCGCSDDAGAKAVFDAATTGGAELNYFVHHVLLDACANCQDLNAAEDIMDQTRQAGMIDVVSFNTLIKAYLQRVQLAEGARV